MLRPMVAWGSERVMRAPGRQRSRAPRTNARISRGAAALGAALALFVAACGSSDASPAPSSRRPLGPPSIPVLQAGVRDATEAGWLGGGPLVFVSSPMAILVWDPVSGRALDRHVLRESCARLEVTRAGLACGPEVLDAETITWTRVERPYGSVLAPTLDRWAHVVTEPRRELVVHGPGERDVRIPIEGGDPVFAPDGALVAVCAAEHVALHDAATGASVLELDAPAQAGCAFSTDGRTLFLFEATPREGSFRDARAVRLLDVASRALDGAPISDVTAADAEGDTLVVARARGPLAGVAILERETREPRARADVEEPSDVALVGAYVVVSGWRGGLFHRQSGQPLTRASFDPHGVAADGRVVHVARGSDVGDVIVGDTDGTELTRLALPTPARPEVAPGALLATGRHTYLLGPTLEPTTMGDCPTPEPSFGLFGGGGLVVGSDGRRHLATPSCLSHDDGTATAMPPSRLWLAPGGGALVREGAAGCEIVEPDGAVRATLPIEPADLAGGIIAAPALALSPAARTVVLADPSGLRVFDGRTGAALGYAERGLVRPELVAVSDEAGRIAYVDVDGELSLLRLPDLEPVRSASPHEVRELVWLGARLLVVDSALHLVDRDGAPIAEAAGPSEAVGELVVLSDSLVRTRRDESGPRVERLALSDLALLSSAPGRLLGATERGALVCRGDAMVAIAWDDAVEHAVTGPCAMGGPVSSSVLAVPDGEEAVRLIRVMDGASVRVVLLEGEHGLEPLAFDGERPLDSSPHVLLRRPEATADGMIPAPAADVSLERWLAGP